MGKHAPKAKSEAQIVLQGDPYAYMAMIETAEIVADRYGISREEQDCVRRAKPAARRQPAQAAGRFDEEIVPITVTKALFDKEGNETGKEGCHADGG